VSAAKRGLGRGLGALLGDGGTSDVTTAPVAAPKRDLQQLPIARIRPNPRQPRQTFAAGALDELRASIAAFGVLVPIIVREHGDGYELIAGERRLRAAQSAGLTAIPALVRAADDRESLEVAIIENLQRENLDPLEEAMGFAHLMDAYDFTQEQVGERLGRSRSAIANALRLLSLSDAVKAFVREGKLSAGHARAIMSFPPERRETMARRAVDEELSVRVLERLAADVAPKRARARAAPARDANDDAFVERLRYKFATQVRLVAQERGGTIELRYADPADLLRIVDLLLGEPS
jgi:ParB family chromosome partitioning protein